MLGTYATAARDTHDGITGIQEGAFSRLSELHDGMLEGLVHLAVFLGQRCGEENTGPSQHGHIPEEVGIQTGTEEAIHTYVDLVSLFFPPTGRLLAVP